MRYLIIFKLIQLILVNHQNLGLAIQTNQLKLFWLVLLVELLVEYIILLL